MIRSLHWRLQIWHAVVLVTVLGIFGGVVDYLQWQTRIQQVDAELDRATEIVRARMWPNRMPRGRRNPQDNPPPAAPNNNGRPVAFDIPAPKILPHHDDAPAILIQAQQPAPSPQQQPAAPQPPDAAPPAPPLFGQPGDPNRFRRRPDGREDGRPMFDPRRFEPNPKLAEEFAALYEGNHETLPYFILWMGKDRILAKSANAPDIPYPGLKEEQGLSERRVQTRVEGHDQVRELAHGFRFDVNMLVGRSLAPELSAQRSSTLLMILAGMGVLAVGLVGDYWLSLHALKPIAKMATTAESISVKNLSERINLEKTDDELGQLAGVLNRTFDGLQAAFEQQSRFTADASHELRTPVSVILSHTELALSRSRSPEEYRDAIETCRRAGQRMKTLIDGLLALARYDAGQPEQEYTLVELDALGRECLDLLRPLADERHITLTGHFEPVRIKGDRSRIVQVLTNLLTNAIRYNREQGSVDARIFPLENFAVIRISDTGIGIPADELPHVFERFYRVDKARSRAEGGTGLGLSICKTIIDAHHGTITIESEPQQGTTVEVRLPLAQS
ncbi:MAG: ATP-binding protein [Planctomycetales bacterium]